MSVLISNADFECIPIHEASTDRVLTFVRHTVHTTGMARVRDTEGEEM